MKCLFCDKEIKHYSLYSLFIEENKLCVECEEKIKKQHTIIKSEKLKIELFYKYDSLFKDILLQYKECYDEALKDIFLYKIEDYLKIKYHGYQILYVPSTKEKTNERGFNHLEKIFERLNMKKVVGLKNKKEISQVNKNQKERQEMKDNFYYEGPNLNKVLIVDDVYTTGSTIKGVYEAMRPYCKKIRAVILAK